MSKISTLGLNQWLKPEGFMNLAIIESASASAVGGCANLHWGKLNLLPRNLTWNLKMMVSKRSFLF